MFSQIEAIAGTVRHAGVNLKELSSLTGMSENYLYRVSTPGASGCELSLTRANLLMGATKIYFILDHLNHTHGFLKIRPPRVKWLQQERGDVLEKINLLALECLQALKSFWSAPSLKARELAERKLYELTCLLEGLRKQLHRDWRQLELNL